MTSARLAAIPPAHPGPTPHFSPVRVAGSLAYVSGQMAFSSGYTLVQGGVAEQTRQCMRNIEAALAPVGLSLDDVVKTTVWLTRSDDFTAFNAAYADALGTRTPPSRSTVRADLMVPGALVEIEAVALLP
jgi:2-iminobutanoate/2-iminopropanoate deaminase